MSDNENALEELNDADAEAMKRLLITFLRMDQVARAHGHTLADVLVRAARDQFGTDIRPTHNRRLRADDPEQP